MGSRFAILSRDIFPASAVFLTVPELSNSPKRNGRTGSSCPVIDWLGCLEMMKVIWKGSYEKEKVMCRKGVQTSGILSNSSTYACTSVLANYTFLAPAVCTMIYDLFFNRNNRQPTMKDNPLWWLLYIWIQFCCWKNLFSSIQRNTLNSHMKIKLLPRMSLSYKLPSVCMYIFETEIIKCV